MAQFSLDDIRSAAEAKYGSCDIVIDERTTAKLVNPLRLSKDKRAKLMSLQDALDEEGADQEALLKDALRTVAEHPAQAKALLAVVGDDLAVLAEVFSRYTAGTQAGEA